MKNDQFSAEYSGARQTELIDRQEILDLIAPTLASEDLWVFHITGKGGMGKTRLAREILRRCALDGLWANTRVLAMCDVVDLYHTHNHVEEGFAQEIVDSLQIQFKQTATIGTRKRLKKRTKKELKHFDAAFEDYRRAVDDFRGSNPAGANINVDSLRATVAQGFLKGLQALSQSYHLVLAIDTAEKLLYESDTVQKALQIEAEDIAVLDWLLTKLLPALRNTTVIITGRPEPEEVFAHLQERLAAAVNAGGHFVNYSLDRFALPDALEYFEAAALAAQAAGDEDSAARIRAIPPETREVIWYYTDGRPILLALLIDYLISSKELLPQVKDSLTTAYQYQGDKLKGLREEIEGDLVRFWEESHRQTSLAVVALGWARKGMDADLLARVADLRSPDGSPDVQLAQRLLETLKNLSFIKIRPTDKRFFLHDEMYDLLDRHVLRRALDPERERVYGAVLEYYENKVKAARKQALEAGQPRRVNVPVGEQTVPGLPKPPDDLKVLEESTQGLYDLIAEEVHYRLRYQPRDGFHSYQAYAKEATWNNDKVQDMLLRSEILDFLKMHRGESQIDGLERAEIDVDNGLRRIESLSKRGSFQEAIDFATKMQAVCSDLIQQAGPLARLRLEVLCAEAMIYLGENFEEAGQALESALIELRALPQDDLSYQWQQHTTLAEAYNTLGYYFRTLGLFQRAIAAYDEAVILWRQLEDREMDDLRRLAMRAQHANTLNNLAWACAEYGQFGRATRYAKDALDMRKDLGLPLPVAFSENTLGLILTRYGRPLEARVHCQRALETFKINQNARGIGLASTALAEALRRASDQEDLFAPEEKADLLREARDCAAEAVGIFTQTIPERSRRVEAYLELGCVYRQWAWLRPKYESADDPDQATLAAESAQAFTRTIDEAGEGQLFFKAVDAHVNLAWLHYYMRANDLAEQAALAAIATVPAEYHIDIERGLPDKTLPHAFYWVQLGKASSLLGQVAMRRFQEGNLESLAQAGLHFTLSLAYDQLFAPDFRDMRRVMDRLYDRLVKLNQEEFKQFHRGIARAAREYHLTSPLRINQFLSDYGLPSLKEPVS
jgi:tetratricopeptide (TPR) repeat protein